MSSDESGERVSPSVLEVGLLYKMLKKLESIEEVLSIQVPIGKTLNIPDGISLTAGDTYIDLVKGIIIKPDFTKKTIPSYNRKLHSMSIENQGADSVVVTVNPDDSWDKKTLDSGDTYNLDMKKAVIENLKLTVLPGEMCTVQLSGVI